MTTNVMMRSMVFFVWMLVSVQIALLIMSGGSDPVVWAGFAINLAAAIYVTSKAGTLWA